LGTADALFKGEAKSEVLKNATSTALAMLRVEQILGGSKTKTPVRQTSIQNG
jgi:hypothetical protein